MRNLKKLIIFTVMIALLLCVALSGAYADEKIYTSPVFHLPTEKLTEWLETAPEETEEPEEEDPTLFPAEEEEEVPQDPEEVPEDPENTPEGETEPEKPQREVKLYSSQGEVVTEGEIITLSSELIGFEGLTVTYQWQVDKGDGAGWVDVEGATKDKHKFVASRETIRYSWRLVVDIK